MSKAAREGIARQTESLAKGYKPYGAGSFETHVQGRLAEIAFSTYLGVPAADPSYRADRQRGCDVIGPDGSRYHVRSTKYPGTGLLIKPNDPAGTYVLVITTGNGYVYIAGWYTRTEAESNYMLKGMRVDPARKIWEIPQADLYPFAAAGYAVAV